jgi:hypothetical protein
MRKGKAKGIVFLACALLVGFFTAFQFNRFLEIRFTPKSLPHVPTYEATPPKEPLPDIAPVEALSVPKGSLEDDLFGRAVSELAEAVEMRTGRFPLILESPTVPPAGRIIAIGDGKGDSTEESDWTCGDAFSIRSFERGALRILAIEGAGRLGKIYGTTWLIDRLYSQGEDQDLYDVEAYVVPALPYRFVDSGAVGIVPDATAWGEDYSHHNRAFQDVILVDDPYVDAQAFQRVKEEFKEYLHRMISYGFNGIVFDVFLEFVNFDRVGSGFQVYGRESPYRKRHIRLREHFSELFAYARSRGMKVVLRTDMLALTKPLEDYFHRELGKIDVTRKRLWQVYGLGVEELFDCFPSIDGIMIRIGEGGAVYNLDGWLYYSALRVKTEDAVKVMLGEFLPVAEKRDKRIFFRNWSVGIGPVGDMHTNPQTYERILREIDSNHLIVSTKYGKGDFTAYLPYNPTLRIGEHKRIIEFQARREFEAFSAFPNYMGPFHQTALQDLLKQNSKIDGLWLWTQRGGPLRAGPLSLYPFHGFWPLIDANVYVTGRLAWNPEADLKALTEIWLRRNFGDDPETIHALAQVLFLSREAVLKGLYIGGYGRKQASALRMEGPPNVWVWDIVSGSSVVLTAIYVTCRDTLEQVVSEGFEAVGTTRRMKDWLSRVDSKKTKNPPLYRKLRDSLDYEENLLQTLAWYRKAFLYYYHWLDTGNSDSYAKWTRAYASFRKAKREHLSTYDKNLDFPAYNFFAADAGMAHALRSKSMAWLARALLILTAVVFLAGSGFFQDRMPSWPGKKGLKALRLHGGSPWDAASLDAMCRADVMAVYVVPFFLITMGLLVFSSFLSPYFVAWIVLSLGVFVVCQRALYPGNPAGGIPLQAALAGTLLCQLGLILAVVSIRGPLYFWYLSWASPVFRVSFLTLGIAGFLWMLFSLYTVSRNAYKATTLYTFANLCVALGAVLVLNGVVIGVLGLETFLTGINNQMAVLPLSLSKVLGLTTHLNMSPGLPTYGAAFGAILMVGGWVARTFSRHAHP